MLIASALNSAPSDCPQPVPLTATVVNPQASLNTGSLSFGNQTVNTGVTKTVMLKNAEATTLQNIAIAVTGKNTVQFTIAPGSNCGRTLAPGNSCTIGVTFKPIAKTTYSATLQATDNAQCGTQTVSLSGTGH